MYFSLKLYSSVDIPVGLVLTPTVCQAFVISSLWIMCLFEKFPLESFISAGELGLVTMVAFSSSSHFHWMGYQKHFGSKRLPPVEWSFLSKTWAISCNL